MAVPTRLGCVFARGLRQLSARDEALLERASRVAPGWTALLDAAKAIPPRESRSVRIAGRRSSIEVIGERKIVHAVGRRKEAVAQVWLEAAKGDALASIVVNNKLCTEYFPWPLSSVAVSPFLLTGTSCNYGAKVVVRGGGMSGARRARALARARALCRSAPCRLRGGGARAHRRRRGANHRASAGRSARHRDGAAGIGCARPAADEARGHAHSRSARCRAQEAGQAKGAQVVRVGQALKSAPRTPVFQRLPQHAPAMACVKR